MRNKEHLKLSQWIAIFGWVALAAVIIWMNL